MNTTDQRIAIAETIGATWQDVPPEDREWAKQYHPKRLLSFRKWDFTRPCCAPLPIPDPATGDALNVPRYTEDMVAIQDAFRKLNPWLHIRFGQLLLEVTRVNSGQTRAGAPMVDILHATAADWAEAFLKTVGKWKPTV